MDKEADAQCIALLRKVENMRKELRTLETELSKACAAYGRRRGMSLFREWHVNNQHEIEQRLENMADRHEWENQHDV
jgi:hypothetical protein